MTSPSRRPSARRASSGGPSDVPPPPPPAASGAPTIRDGQLHLGDRQVPLLSGALHYWRLSPDAWDPALTSIKALGLPMVESYVPWAVHEVSEDVYDFGSQNPSLNLDGFLKRVAAAGLLCFLRPGPHINAELTHFGLPDRIVHDDAMWARSSNQQAVPLIAPPHMFAVPSCASQRFRDETAQWFEAVAEQVRPHLWPQGPVVLLQVDNEAAFYFRDGPYDQDYHPEALAFHRARLRERYGDDAALTDTYGTTTSIESHTPPARCDAETPEQLMPALDWMHSQQALILDSLRDMAASLRKVGLDKVPFVHNLPMGDFGLPTNVASVDRAVGLAGLDYYQTRGDLSVIKRRTLRLCGTVETPFAPELGAGAPPWFVPRTNEDSLFTALTALAFGLRGFNMYMAVARDRWYGAPIDVQGQPRASAEPWRRLFQSLAETKFATLRRHARIGLLLPRHYALLSRATHKLGAISPSVLDLSGMPAFSACARDCYGFDVPIQLRWWKWLDAWDRALTAAQVPFVYIDDDARPERFEALDTLIVPTFETFDADLVEPLRAFAQTKALYAGPSQPRLDQRMRPLDFAPWSQRPLVDQQDIAAAVTGLAHDHRPKHGMQLKPRADGAHIELTVHEDSTAPRVLFLVTSATHATDAVIETPGALRLRDAMSGERFAGDDDVVIPLGPRSCRMLVIES